MDRAARLGEPVKVQFARMKPRRGALCDIPDLELFPSRYAGVQSVMFRAALEVGIAQQAFAFMAFMHRVGLLRAPQKLAPLLHSAGRVFDALGTALGGMVVRVEGTDAQGAVARHAWHIAVRRQPWPRDSLHGRDPAGTPARARRCASLSARTPAPGCSRCRNSSPSSRAGAW
jgi:hypothetical protein